MKKVGTLKSINKPVYSHLGLVNTIPAKQVVNLNNRCNSQFAIFTP